MSAARKAAWADPAVRAKMRRRGWKAPPPFDELYAVLRKKIGAKEARRLVEADIARAARRTSQSATLVPA
jgi:hypothetical protein